MKKRKIAFIVLLVIVGFFICINVYSKTIYAYVEGVKEEEGMISMIVDGVGSHSYKGYKLVKVEDGIYEFKLQGGLINPFSKTLYPVTLTIDNKDGHIKQIIQKNFFKDEFTGPDDYLVIYPAEEKPY